MGRQQTRLPVFFGSLGLHELIDSIAAERNEHDEHGGKRLIELEGKDEPAVVSLERVDRALAVLREGEYAPEAVKEVGRGVGVLLARNALGQLNANNRVSLALLDFLLDPAPRSAEELERLLAHFAYTMERKLGREAVGDPLATMRECFGMGQRAVAGLLGVSPSTVWRWNNRRHKFSFHYLQSLAEGGYWLREAGLGQKEARRWLEQPHERLEGRSPRAHLTERRLVGVWDVADAAHASYCRRREQQGTGAHPLPPSRP